MDCFRWDNCPKQTQEQISQLVTEFRHQLNENLVGIYLHGSLATGCFNPAKSDIDLLVVLHQRLLSKTKERLVKTLLHSSKSPHPLEISFLKFNDLHPWQYPTPFVLHYSEDWREKYTKDSASGNWQYWPIERQTDNDLAAHITVTKKRGVCLWGEPINQTFPDVPRQDFADSITSDLVWAREKADKIAVYAVLNACRIYAYFKGGYIFSKAEGAEWAIENMPDRFRAVITTAFEAYRSSTRDVTTPERKEVHRLLDYISMATKNGLTSR